MKKELKTTEETVQKAQKDMKECKELLGNRKALTAHHLKKLEADIKSGVEQHKSFAGLNTTVLNVGTRHTKLQQKILDLVKMHYEHLDKFVDLKKDEEKNAEAITKLETKLSENRAEIEKLFEKMIVGDEEPVEEGPPTGLESKSPSSLEAEVQSPQTSA